METLFQAFLVSDCSHSGLLTHISNFDFGGVQLKIENLKNLEKMYIRDHIPKISCTFGKKGTAVLRTTCVVLNFTA
jgi:hypothetical protein